VCSGISFLGQSPGREVNHSHSFNEAVKNEGSYTSVSSTCLRGVDKEKLYSLYFIKTIFPCVVFTDSVPSTLFRLRELHVFHVSSMLYASEIS